MSKANDASNRTLTLKKVFNAPVKLVWEAWTNSEHVVQWWAPKEMKINVAEQWPFFDKGRVILRFFR